MIKNFKIFSTIVLGIGFMGMDNASYGDSCKNIVGECIHKKSCDPWKLKPYTEENSLSYNKCLELAANQTGADKWDAPLLGVCILTCGAIPWDIDCTGECELPDNP
jgi:hypothetical protein